MPHRPSICVIGAGLTGLVAARKLARNGFRVLVVEQHSTAGGTLSSMRIGHEYLELIPHHLRKNDRNMLSLFKELGLFDDISWFDSYWYGRAGRKKLGYPERGFHTLVSALTQEITDDGGIIYYGYTALDISLVCNEDKDTYQITCVLADCTSVLIDCDDVLFTGSCRNLAHITHSLDLPTDYRDSLMDVTYRANMTLLLVMKSPLTGCFSRPFNEDHYPFQRIIQHSNLVGERKYGGHILYLSGSFQTTHPMWTQSDSEVFKSYFKALQKTNPTLLRSDIKTWRLTRTRYALPIAFPETSISTPLPGLYICSLAMIGNSSGNSEYRMDSCVALANDIADRIRDNRLTIRPVSGSAPVDYICS
ncbi:MAG TPA: FAD-dependent oxidoreductase [Clostridiaceae bacterium]|nr:FAD-dependent oxidoreductase [Clostridiaceae bacterium]